MRTEGKPLTPSHGESGRSIQRITYWRRDSQAETDAGSSTPVPNFRLYFKALIIKKCGTGTKTNTAIHETEKRTQKEPHTQLMSINVQQRRQEYTGEKIQSLQQVVLGKWDSYM